MMKTELKVWQKSGSVLIRAVKVKALTPISLELHEFLDAWSTRACYDPRPAP